MPAAVQTSVVATSAKTSTQRTLAGMPANPSAPGEGRSTDSETRALALPAAQSRISPAVRPANTRLRNMVRTSLSRGGPNDVSSSAEIRQQDRQVGDVHGAIAVDVAIGVRRAAD